MLKNIVNLKNVRKLDKNQQKLISGGTGSDDCPSFGDPACCGNEPWQCGTGPLGGGTLGPGLLCYCFA